MNIFRDLKENTDTLSETKWFLSKEMEIIF